MNGVVLHHARARPDGRGVRFYSMGYQTELGGEPVTVDNPRETAEAEERATSLRGNEMR
ncbi:hypothetical protein [Nocardia tengchongensis]|uniref:hypothetical protein n=1 Tax=Nocardia tengchongensis TaxID=2055889 RepID=UPI0036BC807E